MKTTLTRTHIAFIILFCIIIHGLMLMSFVTVQFKDLATGPQVIFADLVDPEHQTELESAPLNIPAMQNQNMVQQTPPPPTPPAQSEPTKMDPLVAMSPGANPREIKPPAPAPIPAPIAPTPAPIEPEPESLADNNNVVNEAIDDAKIDEAIALATQILEQNTPKTRKQDKKSEPAKPAQHLVAKNTHTPSQAAQKLTLAQLTSGFMQHIQNETADGSGPTFGDMHVKSTRYGKASMKQLAYINYCKKIISCMSTSYRIQRYNAPRIQQPHMACIQLAINKDGSIHTLSMLQSSGNDSLDQFLMNMFKDASSSFPPLPSSFGQSLELPIFNINSIHEFQSAEYWYIQ